MKTLIQKFLIYLYSLKKSHFEFINPQNILTNSNNVLVLLPEQKELKEEINFVVKVLKQIFKQITFLSEASLIQLLRPEFIDNFIPYSKKEKNFLDLPKKEFIKSLQSKNFDLIIDLNLDDSNFHYWITKSLNAKFKLGLYRKNSTLFNNLVMKVKHIDKVKTVYENFLFLLKL